MLPGNQLREVRLGAQHFFCQVMHTAKPSFPRERTRKQGIKIALYNQQKMQPFQRDSGAAGAVSAMLVAGEPGNSTA
jgi:hypothetical protein